VCLTGLTGVEPLSESCSVPPAGTGLTGGAHRSDRCGSVDSRFGFPLRSRVGRLCVGSQVQWHSSGYVGLTNLCSESETCAGSHVHLVGVSISFEKNFYRLPFTPPPLSGSPYRFFTALAGLTSRRRPVRARSSRASSLRGFRRPFSRVRCAGRMGVGGTVPGGC
jgi:hypothetical protein